jgi:RHS repeat-associated protein
VVIGASSLTNVAGAEPVGRFGPKHPDIAIPKGPFVQPPGRTDESVPGDARNPLPASSGDRTKVLPDPNAGVRERLASTPIDASVALPEQPRANEQTTLKASDGPMDEVSELVTNPDGSRSLRSYSQRRFYKASDGKFSKIDVRLTKGKDGVVVSSGDSVAYRFESSAVGVTVEARKGQPLRFRPDSAATVDPVVSKDGRSVVYADVWPGVDVKYTVSAAGLKEDVVLKRSQDRTEFPFIVEGADVAPTERYEDGQPAQQGTMSVSVGGKDAGLAIAPPVALDKAGSPVAAGVSKIALEHRGRDAAGRQSLALSASAEWLKGLAADAYPVSLDPLVGVTTTGVHWWLTYYTGGTTGLFCEFPTTSGCIRGTGYDGSYLFRTYMEFNLASLWSTIDANSDVQIANAQVRTEGSWYFPNIGPNGVWFAYDNMPLGLQDNFYAMNVMYGLGLSGYADGNATIGFTNRFNTVWRADRAAGQTKWNAPILGFRGNESGPLSRVDLGVTYIDVTFQNRAPVSTAVSPDGEINSATPTLVASGSDPDNDSVSYLFQVCEWDFASNSDVGCVQSPWQAGSTIPAASVKPLFWNRAYRWSVAVGDGTNVTWSSPKWFRASVPPPTAPAWRGGDDPFSGFKGGVNLVTGNYFASQLDAAVASVGPKLQIERSYNSLDPRTGLFGKGWSTLLDLRVSWPGGAAGPTLYRSDGRSEFYGANTDGTLASPQGVGSTLSLSSGVFTLTDPDGTVSQFDSNGRLIKVVDELGHELRVDWSVANQITMSSFASASASTAMRNLTLTTTTVAASTVVTSVKTDSVTGQGQSTWTYQYDTSARLTGVVDPMNTATPTVKTVYEYTDPVGGRLSKWKNPGNVSYVGNTEIELSYQPDGKVSWRKDGTGGQHSYNYATTPIAGESLRVTVTDPRSKTTVWGFDAQKRLARRINELGFTREWVYDVATGFLKQVNFEDSGHYELYEDFNPAGLARKQTAVQDGVTRVSYAQYNAQNNRTESRDPRSTGAADPTFLTLTEYDPSGKKVMKETKPGSGAVSYDWTTGGEAAVDGGDMPAGLLKKKTEPVAGALGAAAFADTTYAYDNKGNLRTMVDPLGKTTTYTYDELGRELTRTETDAGNSIPAGTVWTTTYDKLSRPTKVLEPAVTNVVTASTRQLRTDTFYDNNGNVDRTEQVAVSGGGATRVTKYTYDAADRKKTETVAYGTVIAATTTTDYDANGNIIRTTDPLGRVYETTFTDDNLPDVTTLLAYQPDPQFAPATTVTLTVRDLDYDNAGRASKTTDAEGRQVTTTYEFDQVRQKTLKNFQPRTGAPYDLTLESNTYDTAGNLLSKSEGNSVTVGGPPARKTTYSVNPAGQVETETLFNASNTEERKTTKVYDAAGNVTSEKRKGYTDADREVRSLYNPTTGTLTSTTVENGTTDIVTQFLYDARGLPTQVTDPDNGVSSTTYDQLGHATNALAPTVPNETGGATPVSSRPDTRTGYNAFGETTHERDARGNVTTHTFDEQGRETLVTFPTYTPPGGTAMTPTQSSTYDLVGNLITSVDRRGKTSTFSFDKLNRNYKAVTPGSAPGSTVTTSTFFDRVGNKVRTIDPTGAVTRFTYDMANRTRTQTTELREVGVPLPKMLTSTFDYDSVGNQTWAKDPLGKLTTKTFNGAGQQLTVTDPLFHTSSVTINSFGETVKTTDATNIETIAEFDQAGRQTKSINKGTGGTQPALATVMTYNGRGMRTSTTSPEGRPAVVEWDAAGRMKKVTVGSGADSASTELFYDAAGNNTRVRDARGNAASSSAFDTILNYQSWNLLESRVEPPAPAGQPAANRTWTTSYDGAGLVTKEQQPGSVVLNRTYDDAGRPLTESATGATGSRTYAYDNNGRPTSISHPTSAITVTYDDRGLPRTINGGGGLTQYKWDDNGRLDLRTDPAGTADLSYDDAGRLIGETDPITGGNAEYGYDNAGRRVYVASNGPGGVPANTPVRWTGYDDYGRTSWDVMPDINGGGDEYARAYQYDNDGNQTSTMVWGNSNPADNGFQYGSYNTRGELASWTDTAGATTNYTYDEAGNRTGVGATTYAYDAQNRLTSGGGATYTWTDRGTLASVTSGGTTTNSTFDVYGQALTNGTVTMTYDGLGRIATRNGTAFTYSGQSLDPVSDGAWVTNHSLDGTVLSAKQVGGANARWAVVDSHRNVAGLRNPVTGLVDNSTNFNPFGVKTSTTGSLSTTVGFQGDYTDPTTAEVWMGARHYRPSTATFTSRDSYGGRLDNPISLNRYTYAHNNPLNNWDPNGHMAAASSYQSSDEYWAAVGSAIAQAREDNRRWFYQIAVNNGAEAQFDVWWAEYQTSVLDPQFGQILIAADAAWRASHPRTSTLSAPTPSGVQNISGPKSPIVPHDLSTYPSAARCRPDQPKYPSPGTTSPTTTILPAKLPCPFGNTPGFWDRLEQMGRIAAGSFECTLNSPLSLEQCQRVMSIAIDSENQGDYYASFWSREFGTITASEQDAIRNAISHALFIGRVALQFGDQIAWDLGLRTELWEGVLGSACKFGSTDTTVDLQNNLIGIGFSQQIRREHGGDQQLVERIIDSYATLRRTTNGCNGDIINIGAQF